MYLVCLWFLSLILFEIDLLLSTLISIGDLIGKLISLKNFVNHSTWVVALVNATYSALMVDSVTISCHLLSHETGPSATMKIFPFIDWHIFLQPA